MGSRFESGGTGREREVDIIRDESHLHIPTLICTFLAGILGFFVCELIYTKYRGEWNSVLLVGVYFLVLVLCIFAVMVVMALIRGEMQYHIRMGEGKKIWGFALLGLIALFLAAMLFQFIYKQNFQIKKLGGDPTSYIFVLDDSGSMNDTDPDFKRRDAVINIVEGLDADYPYAIYSFNNTVSVLREFKPASEGIGYISLEPYGGTYMYEALEQVLSDYDAGMWYDNASPRVVLLADGMASDSPSPSLGNLASRFASRGITISTIFLTNNNASIPKDMVALAEKTGGAYLSIDNADSLNSGMQQVASEESIERDLLGRREIMSNGWIYVILRLLFFTLLAIGAKAIMALVNNRGEDIKLIIVFSIITGILAGIMIEVGINGLMLPDALMRGIACILIAVVPATYSTELMMVIRSQRSGQMSRLREEHSTNNDNNLSIDAYSLNQRSTDSRSTSNNDSTWQRDERGRSGHRNNGGFTRNSKRDGRR